MRLSPKRLGDELNLDEYNAYQYLLYNMDCWGETVDLDMVGVTGNYSDYVLKDRTGLLEWYGSLAYRVIGDVDSTTYLEVEFSDPSILPNISLVKFYYQNPRTYTIDSSEYEIYEDPYDDSSELVTESTVPAGSGDEIPRKTVTESKVAESYEDFEVFTVEPSYNGSSLYIPLQLDVDGVVSGVTGEGAMIGKRFKFYIDYLYDKPQIDVANGTANTVEEILLDNTYELTRLIQFSPTNGTKIIYRLDSNKTYKLTSTITIWDGMDVEIRGGTNTNAVLDASSSGRAFIVQDQASLTLTNITIKGGDVTRESGKYLVNYYRGYGGGILVMYDSAPNSSYFGTLTMDNCEINNCVADYGGAIYSFHAGLNLTNCSFNGNRSNTAGGAVYYSAEMVNMTMNNVIASAGETVQMTCYVTELDGDSVISGLVKFYIDDKQVGSTIDLSTDKDGKAVLSYTIPSTAKSNISVTAYYYGGSSYDTQGVQASIVLSVPTKLTATIENLYNVFPGDTITLKAKAVTGDAKTYTATTGYFTVNGKTITATVEDGYYTASYTIPESVHDDLNISFDIPDANTSCDDATIHIIYGVTGYFINSGDDFSVTDSAISNWQSIGVTDVYVRAVNGLDNITSTRLYQIIQKTKNTSIRVHAVMNVFYDINITSGSKWVTDKDARIETIKTGIKRIINGVGDDLTGFCFDYIRLKGTDRVEDNSNAEIINGYLEQLTEYIDSFDTRYTTSVTLMPETSDAKYTYGQAPRDMLEYADYGIPMIYAGNYNKGTSWITETMKWYNDIYQYRFMGALQTYSDDNNCYNTRLTSSTLLTHVKSLMSGGGSGYVLFREGLVLGYPDSWRKLNGED